MSIPVLVRSVGPEPVPGYYTNWTTFIAGYPKFKNQDTGVTSALYNGAAIEANLLSYRAHHLYFTGTSGEIVDRLVDIPIPLPDAGVYYDIPVVAYDPGTTALKPDPGSSSGTAQPSGPAAFDVVVNESFAISTGDAKVTPWHTPRVVQERLIDGERWANLAGAAGMETPASIALTTSLSTQIIMQDFGFNIPAGAVINGIEIELTRKVVGGATENSSRWVCATYGDSAIETIQKSDAGYQYTSAFAANYTGDGWKQAATSGDAILICSRRGAGDPNNIFRSTDKGATFSSIPTGLATAYQMSGIAALGGTVVASVSLYTDTYRILRSTDYGATWAVINTGVGVTASTEMHVVSTDGVSTFVIGLDNGGVLYSVDAGLTWARVQVFVDTFPAVKHVIYSGGKFIAFLNEYTGGPAKIANSSNGSAWALKYTSSDNNAHVGAFPNDINGIAVMPYSSYVATRGILYSTDGGDTWDYAGYPPNPKGDIFGSVIYDQVRDKYLFLGLYPDYWIEVAESPDFPPTSFRFFQDTEAPHRGEWAFSTPPYMAFMASDRYGIRHEEIQAIVGGVGNFTPADAIYDEGRAITGGNFTYRSTFLYLGGTSDNLHSFSTATYGGQSRLGSNASAADGTQGWTAAEIGAPSFGFGYQAEGSSGILQIGGARMRVHYRAELNTDTLPAKRPQGLAGIAQSPTGVKVAVGADGKILRKPANNPTWSAANSGTTVSLNAVAWVGDRFIAVGIGGIALDGGADGSTWTRVQTGAVNSLWAIKRVPDSLRAIAIGNDEFAFGRDRSGVWSV